VAASIAAPTAANFKNFITRSPKYQKGRQPHRLTAGLIVQGTMLAAHALAMYGGNPSPSIILVSYAY
jgi:hypothetical protein